MLSPFIDPVTKSKAEFVTTSDYEPSKAGKDSSSSSSSWFGSSGSWFSSSKQQQQQPASPALSRDSQDADVDIVVEEDQQAVKGPGTFAPLLPVYKTPYCYNRNHQQLSAVGLA
jgi:hypothetical protein